MRDTRRSIGPGPGKQGDKNLQSTGGQIINQNITINYYGNQSNR